MLRVANSCAWSRCFGRAKLRWKSHGPRAFSEGQRPSVSFATDERSRLFWERAETDLVEQLAAASERVFEAHWFGGGAPLHCVASPKHG